MEESHNFSDSHTNFFIPILLTIFYCIIRLLPIEACLDPPRNIQKALSQLPLLPGEVVHVGAVVGSPVGEEAPHLGGAWTVVIIEELNSSSLPTVVYRYSCGDRSVLS